MKILFLIQTLLEKSIILFLFLFFIYCVIKTEWKKEQINKEIKIQKLDDELKDRILRPHLYKNGE